MALATVNIDKIIKVTSASSYVYSYRKMKLFVVRMECSSVIVLNEETCTSPYCGET